MEARVLCRIVLGGETTKHLQIKFVKRYIEEGISAISQINLRTVKIREWISFIDLKSIKFHDYI